MFMYELITLHVPYVDLNAQQANQANEKGERPSLKRKVSFRITLKILFSLLLVLNQGVNQLYAHGSDFLLILTYTLMYAHTYTL